MLTSRHGEALEQARAKLATAGVSTDNISTHDVSPGYFGSGLVLFFTISFALGVFLLRIGQPEVRPVASKRMLLRVKDGKTGGRFAHTRRRVQGMLRDAPAFGLPTARKFGGGSG